MRSKILSGLLALGLTLGVAGTSLAAAPSVDPNTLYPGYQMCNDGVLWEVRDSVDHIYFWSDAYDDGSCATSPTPAPTPTTAPTSTPTSAPTSTPTPAPTSTPSGPTPTPAPTSTPSGPTSTPAPASAAASVSSPSIRGTAFEDLNENGKRDANEPEMGGAWFKVSGGGSWFVCGAVGWDATYDVSVIRLGATYYVDAIAPVGWRTTTPRVKAVSIESRGGAYLYNDLGFVRDPSVKTVEGCDQYNPVRR